jgi:D-amino-acid dehydrogenase
MGNGDARDVIVVGAGIVGVSAALALQQAGRRVLLIDREGPGAGASRANAGAFAFADIVPLATPGILRAAPKWLLDPAGPLSIPPAYLPAIAPWLLRFWRASLNDRFPKLMAAQAGLMALSRDALERQVAATDGEALLQREGQLRLFQGPRAYAASRGYWDACRAHGIRFDLLESPGAIAEIQPGLSPHFTHAGHTPDWINTRDPDAWRAHLHAAFLARGGRFARHDARALRPGEDRVSVEGEAGRLTAAAVVVAAGAWSRPLAASLGDRIPLDTERGYNTTLAPGAFDLRTHLTFPDHGFVVSRVAGGVRVGGAVELGGLKRPPDFRRAEVMLDKAARFLPGLATSGGEEWMGFRPSMPDSLPVIGPSPRAPRVTYAFGHGHLGLTQSAATAEIVRDMVMGRRPALDPAPFSARRFRKGPPA